MLDYIRIALYAVFVALGFFLFQAWEKDHPPIVPSAVTATNTTAPYVPTIPATTATNQAVEAATPVSSNVTTATPTAAPLVSVKTDNYNVQIDTRGGDIVGLSLLRFPEALDATTPFILLNDSEQTRYNAESGLLSALGPDTNEAQALYQTANNQYELPADANELAVPLTWEQNGMKVTKTFIFTRGSYEIKVHYELDNTSDKVWEGNLYTQLVRTNSPPPTHSGLMNLTTYFGAAISTPQKPFQKVPFKDMLEKDINVTAQDGWAAMIQHYFISAWIPPLKTTSTYYSRSLNNNLFAIGMLGPKLVVQPQQKMNMEMKLYSGPASTSLLEKAAPNLQLTIDYGWFWIFSVAIFWMMQKIYNVVGNWGWAIVLVTVIIKLMFYQLSAKSYRSMSGLKRLQPKIEALKERFGDDKQKLTQATLEMYRQEKVNPMSGCLPILIQIPVFIALYWVLVESVELRQAPFILWIRDLSQPDPYYILPVLMGISMFIQQRLNPPPPDPLQAKVMMMMPVIFTVMFANFPAGLMLYWFVNNTLSFLQQWHIMRRLDHETNVKKVKSKKPA